eukprot:TRINITY_DN15504_c0_g1_i4.p3 TRINITY_DN15504_c0_g1~~TRINITY_DN15504_c0_g1_i4.p3  ORF type:complete len:123 (-),score=14.02 TRINITY_DN15504_c0_g1_i4:41-409(-)
MGRNCSKRAAVAAGSFPAAELQQQGTAPLRPQELARAADAAFLQRSNRRQRPVQLTLHLANGLQKTVHGTPQRAQQALPAVVPAAEGGHHVLHCGPRGAPGAAAAPALRGPRGCAAGWESTE